MQPTVPSDLATVRIPWSFIKESATSALFMFLTLKDEIEPENSLAIGTTISME